MVDEQPKHGIIPALEGLAVPIASLMANPVNTRKHEQASLDVLRVSLDKYGQRKPIVVQSHGRIVRAGNGMLAAAKLLGWTHIAAVIVDEPNVDAVSYEIMDNKSAELSTWESEALALQLSSLKADEIDLALTGFTNKELDELLNDLTGKTTDEDTPPEPPPVAVSKRGDLWLCGKHRVLCGDSTSAEDVARVMAGEKAVLVATDPPYLVEYTGNDRPNNAGKDWSEQYHEIEIKDAELFFEHAVEHAVEHAAYYWWHAHKRASLLERILASHDIIIHQQIVWVKPCAMHGYSYYPWQHEPCFFGWKSGHKPAHYNESSHAVTTVWECDWNGKSRCTDGIHPTSKPIEIFAIPMRNHCNAGDVCYEPFVGSGSQLIAAEQIGTRHFGIEIEPTFVDAAITRWANITNAEPTLDGDGRTFTEIAEERGVNTSIAKAEVHA
jgi:DNA modification methylase